MLGGVVASVSGVCGVPTWVRLGARDTGLRR